MPNEQLSLFPPAGAKPKRLQEPREEKLRAAEPIAETATLHARSSLAAAITAYHDQMKRRGWSH